MLLLLKLFHKNKFQKLLAFSLVELLVSLIVISCIASAFAPIITKKVKSSGTTIGGGGSMSIDCAKISPWCLMCKGKECKLCQDHCPEGQFANLKDVETKDEICACLPCNDPTRGFGEGCLVCNTSSCRECQTGYYLVDGMCEKCPIGYYCPDGKNKKPTDPGYIPNTCSLTSTTESCSEGATGQSQCPAGKIAAKNSNNLLTYCKTCTGGTYANPAHSACIDCEKGYYCPESGTDPTPGTKHPCNNGYYCPNPKQTTPTKTPAGTYTPDDSKEHSSYELCTGSNYQPNEAQNACLTCGSGSYISATNSTSGGNTACSTCSDTNCSATGCSGTNCYCPDGTTMQCCSPATFISTDKKTCQAPCPDSQQWNGTACVDKCTGEFYWNGSGCSSRCASSQYWTGSYCAERCTGCSIWNGSTCVEKGDSRCPTGCCSCGASIYSLAIQCCDKINGGPSIKCEYINYKPPTSGCTSCLSGYKYVETNSADDICRSEGHLRVDDHGWYSGYGTCVRN